MEKIKITNNDPIGLYLTQIVIESTGTRQLNEYQKQANLAIKEYSSKPANRENCQELKKYLEHSLALCNVCPNSDGKEELVQAIENAIEILQSGIDREEKKYYKQEDISELERNSQQYRLNEAKKRWEVWGYRNKPIKTSTNTLEGYLRSLPGIEYASPYSLTKLHPMLVQRFFPECKKIYHKDYTKMRKMVKDWYDNVFLTKLLKTLAFVQLTSSQITEQRIIEIYAEKDSPDDAPATAGA